MSKTKSLTQLIEDLQSENERLQALSKHFNRMCKDEFGYDVRTIHQMIAKAKLFEQQHGHQSANDTVHIKTVKSQVEE